VTGGVAGGVPGAVTGGVAATGGPARILITGAAGALGRLLRR
jgi:hypothetical protein